MLFLAKFLNSQSHNNRNLDKSSEIMGLIIKITKIFAKIMGKPLYY